MTRTLVIQGSFIGGQPRVVQPGLRAAPQTIPANAGLQRPNPGSSAGNRPPQPNAQRALQLRRGPVPAGAGPRAVHPASGPRAPIAQPARNLTPRGGGQAFPLDAARLGFRTGPGRTLPAAIQAKMESFFKTSLADVRIHEGPQAQAIGAWAFTMGSDIYFAPGQYNPRTPQGLRLLGHELAHVVQQKSGRARNPFGAGIAIVQDPALEREAEHTGVLILQQFPLTGLRTTPPLRRSGSAVQRMRLVNIDPTWKETTTYVKANPGSYGTVQQKNFGIGLENAFRCPGCDRWLPVKLGTVDHRVPKSVLANRFESYGTDTDTLVNKPYGVTLDYSKVYYRKKKVWRTKKIQSGNWESEDYIRQHLANDLDNLQLMCHSCNSSKRDRDNPKGSGTPDAPTLTASTQQVTDPLNNDVDIRVAPGVDPNDSYPSAKFSAAWQKTRFFFLASEYHSAALSQDFGIGSEPAYQCSGCSRKLPIAIATVDHIKPKNWNWWLSLDLDNLQLMCNICNSSKNDG